MYSALQCESPSNDLQNLGLHPYIKHVSNIGRLIFWKTLSGYSENHNSIFDFSDMRCTELHSSGVGVGGCGGGVGVTYSYFEV
jgi:hypothetical protein